MTPTGELHPDDYDVKIICQADPIFSKVVSLVGCVPLRLQSDSFSFLVHTIIAQMLSAKAASSIEKRFVELCNNNISPDSILSLEFDHLKSIGLSGSKTQYILGLASIIKDNPRYFEDIDRMDDLEVINHLIQIRGIGIWSAKMYLIFVLNRQNVLPVEDMAFIQSFSWAYKINKPDVKTIIKQSSKWNNHSTIVARYLYAALDRGLTKDPLRV